MKNIIKEMREVFGASLKPDNKTADEEIKKIVEEIFVILDSEKGADFLQEINEKENDDVRVMLNRVIQKRSYQAK